MMNQEDPVDKLCDVYSQTEQIGLVLGAGVSKDSGVPLYKDLALNLLELGCKRKVLKAPRGAIDFLKATLQNTEHDPERVLQFISKYTSERSLRLLLKQALYQNVDIPLSHKMVGARTYTENDTLDAVITFCAAASGSMHGADSGAKHFDTNRRVGGILTTNYDALVEGSFGSKYGVKLLKPIARERSREYHRGKKIPVYHMHGYVSYVQDPKAPDGVKASEQLVIAESH